MFAFDSPPRAAALGGEVASVRRVFTERAVMRA